MCSWTTGVWVKCRRTPHTTRRCRDWGPFLGLSDLVPLAWVVPSCLPRFCLIDDRSCKLHLSIPRQKPGNQFAFHAALCFNIGHYIRSFQLFKAYHNQTRHGTCTTLQDPRGLLDGINSHFPRFISAPPCRDRSPRG